MLDIFIYSVLLFAIFVFVYSIIGLKIGLKNMIGGNCEIDNQIQLYEIKSELFMLRHQIKTKFADEMRELVKMERETCAAVAEKHEFCRPADRINGDCDCEQIAEAIRRRTE